MNQTYDFGDDLMNDDKTLAMCWFCYKYKYWAAWPCKVGFVGVDTITLFYKK